MGARLAATVYVTEPGTNQTVRLDAGSEPPAELAALVTNPSAWEGGKLPSAPADSKSSKTPAKDSGDGNDGDDSADTKPARKTAARKTAAS
ncbi:hypothetical protein ACWGH4_00350 [Streptomyces sp. NPDC054847]